MKKRIVKINDIDVSGAKGYYSDGCHKFYLLYGEEDIADAKEHDPEGIHLPLDEKLVEDFRRSCPLRFINTWKLEPVVEQFEETVEFTFEDETVAVFDADAEYAE